MSKIQVKNKIQVNAYEVLRRAVEEGITLGWRHAHKHTEKPDPEQVREQIANDIMNEVCEYFKFED